MHFISRDSSRCTRVNFEYFLSLVQYDIRFDRTYFRRTFIWLISNDPVFVYVLYFEEKMKIY